MLKDSNSVLFGGGQTGLSSLTEVWSQNKLSRIVRDFSGVIFGSAAQPRFTHAKSGFTLSEVLITLGIIGVVAAMTLPALVQKNNAKVLETALKKAYSNASQAYLLTKSQLGVDNIHETYTYYDSSKGGYIYASEFINEFYKNLKIVKKINFYPYKNYNGTRDITSNIGSDYPSAVNILPDGSSIGVIIVMDGMNGGRNIWISFDTNGPYKKPNRYGHDIFKFMIDKSDKLIPVKNIKVSDGVDIEKDELAGRPCSIKNKQLSNGAGCSWYAINNINPDDETKTYWDNLPK